MDKEQNQYEGFNTNSAIQPDGQLAIPPVLKSKLKPGTLLSWQENKDGTYTLTPIGDVGDNDWFWTREWQEGEYRVDLDLKNGNYTVYESAEELIEALKEDKLKKSAENKPENSN